MSCIECPRLLDRNHARGLCSSCYGKRYRAGTYLDLPRRTWARDEVLTEWQLLRSEGFTRRQAAERLGIKFNTFERAICRARAAQS